MIYIIYLNIDRENSPCEEIKMNDIEGVIKYRLEFKQTEAISENLQELNVWRSILYQLQLIGQDAQRYGGFGYGNLSIRSQQDASHFIISGTQTGGLVELGQEHYVRIDSCDVRNNWVSASGPIEPSSEALTHAMFYQLKPSVKCVIHVHDPNLWCYGLENSFPCTDKMVAFGTPEMGAEVKRLFQKDGLKQIRTLVMAGHEDGVICFGDSIEQAGAVLLELWRCANTR